MEEMSITPEEFEIACMEGKNLSLLTKDESDGHSFSFHKGLFQQIWAANDIRTFVRLMKQRNLEIQIQGMNLINLKRPFFVRVMNHTFKSSLKIIPKNHQQHNLISLSLSRYAEMK
jgi:hypothetical protein